MRVEEIPMGGAPEALEFGHFPSRHQAVIWRNWELVPPEKLAVVLGTSEDEILSAAADMGLRVPPETGSEWFSRGYITIIRANWHLLPYEQLLELLGWPPDKLVFHLKEDDFLWTKLGQLKPSCERVVFRKLSDDEIEKTREIKKSMSDMFDASQEGESPFSFIEKLSALEAGDKKLPGTRFGENFVYSYFSSYGDAMLSEGQDVFPEGVLRRYAEAGVRGIWLHTILYTLCPISEAPAYSAGWEKRLENLSRLVDRAAKYGLGVYLYLNEPRGMLPGFFEDMPSWKGAHREKSLGNALCTSAPGVLEWLETACSHVFSKVPGLAGAFTITMSENLTHCHSKPDAPQSCPRCSERPAWEIVAEVNKSIERGIHASSPEARIICWTWGWQEEWENKVIDLLPENVELMCVSEWGKKINVGGVENIIEDYSISVPGPSERSLAAWKRAVKKGMKTVAKVQANNSWECSTVPYLPVPYLVEEHLKNLAGAGVERFMLSWTLGGYPGGNLELLKASPDELAEKHFGSAADAVKKAWKVFGEAFRNFPFNIQVLYMGPQNAGTGNLFFPAKTGYRATMVGLPYDDLASWRANYPEEVFESLLKSLSEGWGRGLDILREAGQSVEKDRIARYNELKSVAEASYCCFRSAYNHTRFVRARDAGNEAAIQLILDDEIRVAVMLHGIMLSDSRIGFEATNHYHYTANDLKEKVLNCLHLKTLLVKSV